MLSSSLNSKRAIASITFTLSSPVVPVSPLYSVLKVNLMSLVTEPLTYRRMLLRSKSFDVLPPSRLLDAKLVRMPAPTLTAGNASSACAAQAPVSAANPSAAVTASRAADTPRSAPCWCDVTEPALTLVRHAARTVLLDVVLFIFGSRSNFFHGPLAPVLKCSHGSKLGNRVRDRYGSFDVCAWAV